jgi:hypothetical protein
MSNKIIRKLLDQRLETYAEIKDYPVATENNHFDPIANAVEGKYLESFLLPANTVSDDLAGAHRGYRGVYQIDICVRKGTGTGIAETVMDELAALFPVNLRLTDTSGLVVQVMTPVRAPAGRLTGNGWLLSTSFTYRSENFS